MTGHTSVVAVSPPRFFPDVYSALLFFPNQISLHNAAKPKNRAGSVNEITTVTASAPCWEMKPSSRHRLIDAKCRKMRREHSCSVSNASAGAKCVSCVLGVFPLCSDTGGSGLPRLRLSDLRLVGMLMWNVRWRPGIETRWVFFLSFSSTHLCLSASASQPHCTCTPSRSQADWRCRTMQMTAGNLALKEHQSWTGSA